MEQGKLVIKEMTVFNIPKRFVCNRAEMIIGYQSAAIIIKILFLSWLQKQLIALIILFNIINMIITILLIIIKY